MLKIERKTNWEDCLSAYIASKRDEPFDWADNDCCYFCAGAVEVMTGLDAMLEFRGEYSNEFGSLRALIEIGKGNLEKTLDAKFPTVEVSHAQRGDLAFFDGSIGVIMGAFAWFVSDNGLERVKREFWDKCWGIGHG